MPVILDLGWKSALIAAAALAVLPLLRQRAAAERVALLRSALIALLLLPALALVSPEWTIAALPAAEQLPAQVAGAIVDDRGPGLPSASWLSANGIALLYAGGAVGILAHLLIGWLTLRRWSRDARPMDDPRWTAAVDRMAARLNMRRTVRLRMSGRVETPLSWGLLPAWVLIDRDTAAHGERAEAVVVHELTHVSRFDWPMLFASRIAVALFWFNPLVWLVASTLSRNSELAADEEAVRHVRRTEYAQALLSLGSRTSHPAACAMGLPRSGLGRRICSILEAGGARPSSRLVCVSTLAYVALAMPLAAMQLVRAPAEPLSPAVVANASAATPPPKISASAARPRNATPRAPARPARLAERPVATATAATNDFQRHAGHAPIAPHPVATAMEMASGQGGPAEQPMALALEGESPSVSPHAARPEHAGALQTRNLPADLAGAARQMRLQAQRLETEAADPAAPLEIRRRNPVTASSLRQEAGRLDGLARRARGSPGT